MGHGTALVYRVKDVGAVFQGVVREWIVGNVQEDKRSGLPPQASMLPIAMIQREFDEGESGVVDEILGIATVSVSDVERGTGIPTGQVTIMSRDRWRDRDGDKVLEPGELIDSTLVMLIMTPGAFIHLNNQWMQEALRRSKK